MSGQEDTLVSDTINNTRNMRFGEILIVKPSGVEVYNTTGVSDCPAQLWDALDVSEIRRQFHALKVEKNGPHFWMMDSQAVAFGEKASFGGIEARWVAKLPMLTALAAVTGSKPYKVFYPKKTQKMVYDKGKPVYELDRSRRKRLRPTGSGGTVSDRLTPKSGRAVETTDGLAISHSGTATGSHSRS